MNNCRSGWPIVHCASIFVTVNRTNLKGPSKANITACARYSSVVRPPNHVVEPDLGLRWLEVGRVPDAIAAVRRAVGRKPRYTDAYSRMGIAMDKLGDLGGAILAYDRATALLPSQTQAWF